MTAKEAIKPNSNNSNTGMGQKRNRRDAYATGLFIE
jgi:hypothetical protein